MRKKDSKVENSTKTSIGGYVFIGIIILIVVLGITVEQLRKFNERSALKYGLDNICTIVELSRQKTLFVKYSYRVDGEIFYSHRAAPFSLIFPGEMFKMKYLKDNPKINKILFEYPIVLKQNQSKLRGYIKKIDNNKTAIFHYKFKGVTYERWQLLRDNHSFKEGDYIDIIVIDSNPKIGIINY